MWRVTEPLWVFTPVYYDVPSFLVLRERLAEHGARFVVADDSAGRDPFVRMTAFGYNYGGYRGENIAAGYNDAARTFNLWRNSPGHNANMLNSNFKVIGISRAYCSSSIAGHHGCPRSCGVCSKTIRDLPSPRARARRRSRRRRRRARQTAWLTRHRFHDLQRLWSARRRR